MPQFTNPPPDVVPAPKLPVLRRRPAPGIEDQIAAVRREIVWRENTYPYLVAAGDLTIERAEKQIAAMVGVLETLVRSKNPILDGETAPYGVTNAPQT